MITVTLTAPAWSTSGATSARGQAHLDGRYLDAFALAATLDACADYSAWRALVARLNGSFAAITRRGASAYAAVDRIRSIPLFHAATNSGAIVSDSAHAVARGANLHGMDAYAAEEFHLTGYVTGPATLVEDLFQIEAGHTLAIDATTPPLFARDRYYDFRHGDFLDEPAAALFDRLESTHERVFRRLRESVGDRPVVVPLSGGYDSRLIGVMLRDLGFANVTCYTYGAASHWEARISRELAQYLGFRWEFVPYTAERWRAWAATEAFRRYFREAGNLASVPHLQDWPAVHELVREARVAADSVFVPGHSGDFLAGSHVPTAFAAHPVLSRRQVLDTLETAHYSLWDWPRHGAAALRERVDRAVEAVAGALPATCSSEESADFYERWDLRERQAKFICNSVRVYEAAGFEWRLPLFDAELMDLWARIPVTQRIGRGLYFDFVRARQKLPVTAPNTDRGGTATLAVTAMDALRLRPLAKRARRAVRRWRWEREYANAPLAWFALVERDEFGRAYTGRELFHSFMAKRYAALARSFVREQVAQVPDR